MNFSKRIWGIFLFAPSNLHVHRKNSPIRFSSLGLKRKECEISFPVGMKSGT